jgi:hypothetical protein
MAAGNTYVPISTNTLASATASVTLSSIPGTYTDLVLIVSGANGGNNFYMKINGSSSSLYSTTYFEGDGSTASSGRFDTAALGGNGMLVIRGALFSATNTNITTCLINIMNYSNTTTFKSVISRGGVASNSVGASANLFQSTAAITQLECYPFAANWAIGTTFNLYGIKAA